MCKSGVVFHTVFKLENRLLLIFHISFPHRCQLCDRNQDAIRIAGFEGFECAQHHDAAALSKHICHLHIKTCEPSHGFCDRVRNVIKLQVKENVMAHRPDLFYDIRPVLQIEFHSDFDEERLVELLQEVFHFLNRAKIRSEEHTSELQSRFDLVCRLLPEK